MLNLYLFENQFDELLASNEKIKKWQIVCPSPQRADLYRDILIRRGLASTCETITIAKFLSDHLVLDDSQKKLSKSELMVDLWTFWKSAVNDDYEKFHFSFELFTEVRSYDLSQNLIEELGELETLERECIAGLMRFHTYVENFNIVDEQKSYQLVSEQFKAEESLGYIFIGFDHLNANQIDMLKGIGNQAEVFVPINKDVFNQCEGKVFWPNWIETQQIKDEMDLENIECEYISIPSGRSAEYFSDLITSEKQLISFSSSLDLSQVNSVLIPHKRFKTDFALFFSSVDQITAKIQEQLILSSGVLSCEEIQKFLTKLSLLNFNQDNFIKLKTIFAFKKEIQAYSEKATINEELRNSDLKLIKEVLGLNLPRTSVVNLSKDDSGVIGIRDNLLSLEDCESKFLYISKDDLGALTAAQRFSNDVLVIFSAFGPLQSKALDIAALRSQIRAFVQNGGKLVLEEGLLHGNSIAESLFDGISLQSYNLETKGRLNFEFGAQQKASVGEKLSPSFIQTYIDCPKKWHLKYAQGVDLDVSSSAFIDRRYIGTINHSVIEAYVEKHEAFNDSILKELIKNTLNRFIVENSLLPEKIDIESLRLAIESYCSSIIIKLLEIQRDHDVELIFERDISKVNDEYKGYIDLLIKKGNDYYIYDFKTSGGSIPNKTDIVEYRKIQLVAYYRAWSKEHNLKGGGYLCLENLKDSFFIGEDIFFGEFHSKSKQIEEINLDEFQEHMKNIIHEMGSVETWPARPISNQTCTFCVANPVCAKGEA